MNDIDSAIIIISNNINKNLEKFNSSERGVLAQNILSQSRNLVEHIALKEYSKGVNVEINYEKLQCGIKSIQTSGKLGFLRKFHNRLQGVTSHFLLDENSAERLMLRYYEYFIKIKVHMKNIHGLDILQNINKFPLENDNELQVYYKEIAEKIIAPTKTRKVSPYKGRCRIQKIKPFYVGGKIFYEVTFATASSSASKFDRVIAFTQHDIPRSYCVKFLLVHDQIEILGTMMPIQIIDNWETSIRPCEFQNLSKIFNKRINVEPGSQEYKNLMTYLTTTCDSIVDIMTLPKDQYLSFKQTISEHTKSLTIIPLLDECRKIIVEKKPAANIIRYLLNSLDNRIIKLQHSQYSCSFLSGLNLKLGCNIFETMPFCSSLIDHNPKLADIMECINPEGREHEFLAKHIKNNIENSGQIYLSLKEFQLSHEEVYKLAQEHNSKLYLPKHEDRKLNFYDKYIYINKYEADTVDTIKLLKAFNVRGFVNYQNSAKAWVKSSGTIIDSIEKQQILEQLFQYSKVSFIYGAAGTGKTRLIEYISAVLDSNSKLFLTKTHPARENLHRRFSNSKTNCTFKTIDNFLSPYNHDYEYDLLIIDECSTVGNSDIKKVLEKGKFLGIVLVGDLCQIESIMFGNWFKIAQEYFPSTCVFELKDPHRTTDEKLIELWQRVRHSKDDVLEQMEKYHFSSPLNKTLFKRLDTDEIILCLSYDGLYGINNINRYLQQNNPSSTVEWGLQNYKIGDPILFNETDRFSPIVHNNLKGNIVGINKTTEGIWFDIEIDKVINELQAQSSSLQLIESVANGNSIIRFFVSKENNSDDDNDSVETIVPFQIAYAVSIHKAQGLEYNSVKVIISTDVEDMITKNIFYTAITRAKTHLKIYWSPETENKILTQFKKIQPDNDLILLKKQSKLK